ncbi:crotonase/enoyl-CoA hydratase family protein [Phreatobacter stygius]|uniref:crotonase/enoyl-CoA hydratase family protein n=1 Tax=Phreatobacter stygius TaxID=1940610 RepID=UPI001C076D84|nr:crotonase/enoyl-CoA hydratase family protein [Phreatobacter stygius]
MNDRVSIDLVDGVADVRLNRPDKMNALDPAMFDGLTAAGEALRRQAGVRAVVLSGEGKGFCAGLDMGLFQSMVSGGTVLGDLRPRTHGPANAAQQAVMVWRSLPVPVIAAIHGVALGGGFQIALGADIRYVAPEARLSVLEIKWGLVPDMGGVALMRELARADVIRELTFTGRMFSGTEALAFGFATALHADPRAAALATARDIAGRSPDAMRAAKRLLNLAGDGSVAEVLQAESDEQAKLIGSPNQIEAVLAGVENRAPAFRAPPA